jgi:hypothetical protein
MHATQTLSSWVLHTLSKSILLSNGALLCPILPAASPQVPHYSSFNVFAIQAAARGYEMQITTLATLDRLGLTNRLSLPTDKIWVFLNKLAPLYSWAAAYHNITHAADVVQTFGCISMHSQVKCPDVEVFAGVMSFPMHDACHNGER